MSCEFRLYRKDHVIDQTPSTPSPKIFQDTARRWAVDAHGHSPRTHSTVYATVTREKCTLWWTNIAMERPTIFNGKIHYKWPFSIAMLVHQRVQVCFYVTAFGFVGRWFLLFFFLADPPSSGLQMGPSKLFHSFWNLTLAEKLYVINQMFFLRKNKKTCFGVQWESWIATTISKYIILQKKKNIVFNKPQNSAFLETW